MNNFISDVVTDLGSLIDQNFGTLELGTWNLGLGTDCSTRRFWKTIRFV